MSLLSVKSLSLTLGIALFKDLSFTLTAGDRLGLIDRKRLTEVDDPEAFFAGELG